MGDPGGEPERIIKTDLRQYANRRSKDGPYADNLDIDVLIIGAGFGGSYALYEMRKQGFSTVLYDAGQSFGGTWRWNVYPGARVDSPVGESPVYELAIPEVYNTWTWSTNYPGWGELQAYFDHVDKVLNLSKDCAFESVVTSAEFDKQAGKWTIKTEDGRTAKAKFLIVAAGFAAKRYIPGFESMDRFRGIIHHSSFWPPEGVDYAGKRVAIIGTGASGVQMIQEMGATAKQLTVFQRTPNLTLPMGRRDLTKEEQLTIKSMYPQILAYREKCFAGFDYDLNERNTFDDTPEEREAFYEGLWKKAGFALWLGGYKDYLFDQKANRASYDFWRKKQSARVKNPEKKAVLFPEEPPHPFGVKRPCLEQNYYEILDQDNVAIVSLSEATGGTSIKAFTEKGIQTADGKEHEFDIIALATGFDVVTGGMTNMGLKSVNNTYLQDEWKDGANTYLGTTIAGYPNMFHMYGPHGPTLLSNGPTCVEIQTRWIKDAINMAKRQNLKYVVPTDEAQKKWKDRIEYLGNLTLFPTTRSTYMGGTVPGKKFEMTCYAGGIGAYHDEIRGALTGWQGFDVVAAA